MLAKRCGLRRRRCWRNKQALAEAAGRRWTPAEAADLAGCVVRVGGKFHSSLEQARRWRPRWTGSRTVSRLTCPRMAAAAAAGLDEVGAASVEDASTITISTGGPESGVDVGLLEAVRLKGPEVDQLAGRSRCRCRVCDGDQPTAGDRCGSVRQRSRLLLGRRARQWRRRSRRRRRSTSCGRGDHMTLVTLRPDSTVSSSGLAAGTRTRPCRTTLTVTTVGASGSSAATATMTLGTSTLPAGR